MTSAAALPVAHRVPLGGDVRAFARGLSLLLAATLAAPAASFAQSLDPMERAELAATVADFNAAMVEARFDRIVDTIPPRMLASIAQKGGATAEQIRPAMIDLMKSLLAAVKIESFGMGLDRAQFGHLPGGAPYALIPTSTVLDLGDKGRFEEKSYTVGLVEDGKWYLVRVNDASQLVIMREVYPEFTGIEIPRGSMEALKQ